VDVEAVLTDMASKKDGGGNWQSSIVDLLKLLDLDSSLAARKGLAAELGVHAGTDGRRERCIAQGGDEQACRERRESTGKYEVLKLEFASPRAACIALPAAGLARRRPRPHRRSSSLQARRAFALELEDRRGRQKSRLIHRHFSSYG
jgi:hypothetical protein